VVIPARGESVALSYALKALLCDSSELDLKVIVVANGGDCAETGAYARAFGLAFAQAGHQLLVIEQEIASKIAALNSGDRATRRGPVVYLDADVVILPGTLRAMAGRLHAAEEPLFICPPLRVVRPTGWVARQYANVWSCLPAVQTGAIGAGCYAVNRSGRLRWGDFPQLTADDGFASSLFAPHERHVLSEGGFYFALPSGSTLLSTRRRWRRGMVELRTYARQLAATDRTRISMEAKSGIGQGIRSCFSKPHVWFSIPTFAVISLVCRFGFWDRRSVKPPGSGWSPQRIDWPRSSGSATKPRIKAVIVTYNSEADILGCLASLRSSWSEVSIHVVDNASADQTVARIAESRSDLRLMQNAENRGFAKAVNDAAGTVEGYDFVLLLNPDATLERDTIDALLALAFRYPDAGIYGGRMMDEAGYPDPTCCLAQPSLGSTIAFGLGLSAVRGAPILDPDSLNGWRRVGTREVPVLTAGVMLVAADLWTRLNGFDDRFFVYGEDVDLCVRARRIGARPMFTDQATYRHRGGASSGSRATRMIMILTGKATLMRLRWSASTARLGVVFLLCGVAIRAVGEKLRANSSPVWRTAWAKRKHWMAGWISPRSLQAE
jgi:GT2 family glycosyltransferase